jgi:hypothetical protein
VWGLGVSLLPYISATSHHFVKHMQKSNHYILVLNAQVSQQFSQPLQGALYVAFDITSAFSDGRGHDRPGTPVSSGMSSPRLCLSATLLRFTLTAQSKRCLNIVRLAGIHSRRLNGSIPQSAYDKYCVQGRRPSQEGPSRPLRPSPPLPKRAFPLSQSYISEKLGSYRDPGHFSRW